MVQRQRRAKRQLLSRAPDSPASHSREVLFSGLGGECMQKRAWHLFPHSYLFPVPPCSSQVRLLQSLDHPNIIRYMESFLDDDELVIVFEW